MKLIEPKVEFLGEVPVDYVGNLKFIERAGRTCYKSENKITDTSAEAFVKKLVNAGHLAMVEHSNFVVRAKNCSFVHNPHYQTNYLRGLVEEDYVYVSGNIRAWFEFGMTWGIKDFLKPFADIYGPLFNIPSKIAGYTVGWAPRGIEWKPCPQSEIPKELRRYSVKFICDRGVSHEIVRHRPCSFAQESTRYVTYNGDGEFIIPAGFSTWPGAAKEASIFGCRDSLDYYIKMLNVGMRPEQARAVLPNAVKTELVVTADPAEWRHIKQLRTSKAAHPDMQHIMAMVPWEEFL